MTLPEKAAKIMGHVSEVKKGEKFWTYEVSEIAPLSVKEFFKNVAVNFRGSTLDDYTFRETVDFLGEIARYHKKDESADDIYDYINFDIQSYQFCRDESKLLCWLKDCPSAGQYCTMALQEYDTKDKTFWEVIALGRVFWKKAILQVVILELKRYKISDIETLPCLGDRVTIQKTQPQKGYNPIVSGVVVAVDPVFGSDSWRIRIRTDQESPCFKGYIELNPYTNEGTIVEL